MGITYAINWDNGNSACGTFPDRFTTEEEAEAWGNNWADQRNLEDLGMTREQVDECGGESCYTFEVIEIEDEPEPDEEELLKREAWE